MFLPDFEQVKFWLNLAKLENDCCFTDFELVKKLISQQNSLRRNWMPEQLSGQLIYVPGNTPWLLRPVTAFSSSEPYPDYFWLPTFLDVQASSFLIHSPFLTQSVRLPLVTYPLLCSTCVTYRMPCHPLVTKCFPPNSYLGKQRISLGVATILNIYLCSHT